MSNSWDRYAGLILTALISLVIPITIWIVWRVLPARRGGEKREKQLLGATGQMLPFDPVGLRFNTRFFQSAAVALVVISLLILLVPLVVAYQVEGLAHVTPIVILLVAIIALCLFYSSRKGDTNWSRSYRDSLKPRSPGGRT